MTDAPDLLAAALKGMTKAELKALKDSLDTASEALLTDLADASAEYVAALGQGDKDAVTFEAERQTYATYHLRRLDVLADLVKAELKRR